MKVVCQNCHTSAEVYATKGIETVIVAHEPGSSKLWLTWAGWRKAICADCLKSIAERGANK